MHYGGGGMWFLLMFIVLIVIFAGAFALRGDSSNREQPRQKEEEPMTIETALDILNKRYAKGELSTEQYEEMKKRILN